MKMSTKKIKALLAITVLVLSSNALAHSSPKNLTATYGPNDALDNDFITAGGELLRDVIPNREIARLHDASGYYTTPTQRHTLPPYYELPDMDNTDDFIIHMAEMVTINPAPREYVTIMEGKRHGFINTTIGITYTEQGGGAPLHTHETEESHTLVTGGKVRYQLGDEVFVVKGPYIINIPPMVPHAFMNLKKKPIKLVVTFPHNEWEADFVEHQNAKEFFTLPNQHDHDDE